MSRFVYEFFRPRVGAALCFPIGVIAEDRDGATYTALRDVQLPDDVDTEFYGLDDRERFMNEEFLPRIEASEEGSGPAPLLEALRRRGTHHFVYSKIRRQAGSASDVAAAEAERLKDKDARREVVKEVLDPTTRAALELYA
jgi:hypothetical protein